jgi:hypothetical protein
VTLGVWSQAGIIGNHSAGDGAGIAGQPPASRRPTRGDRIWRILGTIIDGVSVTRGRCSSETLKAFKSTAIFNHKQANQDQILGHVSTGGS